MREILDPTSFLPTIAFCLAVCCAGSAMAQGTQEPFGQNRVQYKEFTWQFFESDHFITYFNKGGQELGRFASQMAETDLLEIEEMLDYRINRQINVIVYNTISDFNQTNIGASAETSYNTGGETVIIGNKMFIYFSGSHKDMRRQIREGIARILISNMVFGGNLQEIVQNAVLLNLPEWFVEGLVAYIGEEWNADLDDKLRDGMLAGDYDKFNKLTGEDARFAGHSLWYFIADRYGVSNIPNLLYLIRVNRSLENGFLFVLGNTVNQTVEEWKEYYLKKYEQEQAERQQPDEAVLIDKKYRKRFEYHSPALSPTGKHVAYVTDDEGRFKVRLQELGQEGKTKARKVKKGGFKTRNLATDFSYPILAWDKHGRKLAIIFEKRARTRLVVYDLESGEKEESEIARFQRIQHAAFTKDSRKLVLSAVNRGQSDIYIYYITNARIEQITNDFYDDIDPAWVKLGEEEGVLFASNRESDTLLSFKMDSILPVGNLDLWFYNYNEKKRKLIRVTETPGASESQPMQYDEEHFAYLSDQSGIRNRYAGYLDTVYDYTRTLVFFRDSVAFGPKYDLAPYQADSLIDSIWRQEVYKDTAVTFPVSNFARNLRDHSIAPRLGKSIDFFYVDGKPQFFLHKLPEELEASLAEPLKNTAFREATESRSEEESALEEQEEAEGEPGFYFQTEFPEVQLQLKNQAAGPPPEDGEGGPARNNVVSKSDFRKSRIRAYKLQFATESVTTQLDNSLFINKYQSFRAGGGQFDQPNLSGLFTVSIADLFEDYRFIGGFRLPTSFDGSEYLMMFQDNSRRLDIQTLYYYKAERTAYNVQPVWNSPLEARVKTNIAQVSLSWPLDVIRSVRGHFTYRNDKIQFLAADIFGLNVPNEKDDWISAKFEYVHDNTIKLGLNLPEGLRWKAWYEMHKGFEVNTADGLNLSFDDGFLGVAGLDVRHYLRIHRQIIWANRFATASSFGKSKLIYYLGGVDSWIASRFNESTVVDFDRNYAFQTIATNMRGFEQNIRNGSAYAVINSELRVPVFTYLINKPIRSEIIRNFQAIGFFDAGSAWHGLVPFDDENRFNVTVIENGPVTTTINYFQNPLVFGYGFGARTLLFGYFLRFDMAWGLDTGEITDPIYYFSLTTDF